MPRDRVCDGDTVAAVSFRLLAALGDVMGSILWPPPVQWRSVNRGRKATGFPAGKSRR